MTEIEQKAENYAERMRTEKEKKLWEIVEQWGIRSVDSSDRQVVYDDSLKRDIRKEAYIAGATEASKVFEKQIEGLKDANRGLEDMYFMICKEKAEQNEELTEAKELLKTCVALLGMFNSSNGSVDNLIAKVEAFLKE